MIEISIHLNSIAVVSFSESSDSSVIDGEPDSMVSSFYCLGTKRDLSLNLESSRISRDNEKHLIESS